MARTTKAKPRTKPTREATTPTFRTSVMSASMEPVSIWLNRFMKGDGRDAWLAPSITDRMKEVAPEAGVPVLRISSESSRSSVVIPMSFMTEDALDAFVDAIKTVAEIVRPEIQAADSLSKAAHHEHGIHDERLYRGVPQIRGDDGSIVFYIQGVQQRFEGPEDVVGEPADPASGS